MKARTCMTLSRFHMDLKEMARKIVMVRLLMNSVCIRVSTVSWISSTASSSASPESNRGSQSLT